RCHKVREINPYCRDNLTVAFKNVIPYCYTKKEGNENEAYGILKGLIKTIFDTCCLGCYGIKYTEITDLENQLLHNQDLLSTYDLVLPVRNKPDSQTYNTKAYTELLQIHKILSYSQIHRMRADTLLKVLMRASVEYYPLFAVGIVMAFCAGAIVWLLEFWNNKEQFPRQIVQGIIEGWWWAYISMTTVGYGDKTPKSIPARLIAVVWILFGITLFNMYTASLTSIVTTTMAFGHNGDFQANKILGHLSGTDIFESGDDVIHKEYETFEQLTKAFRKDQINILAMEEHASFYYYNSTSPRLEGAVVVQKMEDHFSSKGLGVVSKHKRLLEMLRSFVEANEDLSLSIAKRTGKMELTKDEIFEMGHVHADEFQFEIPFPDSPRLILITVAGTLFVVFVCILIAMFVRKAQEKREERKCLIASQSYKMTE
uniref:Potassium channel domain-containing protein n=2 Tax=Clytia hemisphaerica TaxID=252671 RepID=A0A7M5WT19_9CNID